MSSAQLAPLVNTFKHALHSHRPQVGMFMGLNNPISAEILATCGFDFLLIDCEHGINDMPTVQAQLQAMAPYPTQVLVRPVDHNPATLKQLLGMTRPAVPGGGALRPGLRCSPPSRAECG